MTEKNAEEISMLMDDALDEHGRARVIHKLKDDDELKSCWEHYHLIGEALRNNLPEVICPDLANRINSILHHEPSHRFPQTVAVQATPHNRAVTGFALAASVAVIAVVLGMLQISDNNALPDQRLAARQEVITTAPEIEPVAMPQGQTVALLPLSNQSADLRTYQVDATPRAVDTRFYDYLIHHNEFAVTMPVQGGMMPYARMVGYASTE